MVLSVLISNFRFSRQLMHEGLTQQAAAVSQELKLGNELKIFTSKLLLSLYPDVNQSIRSDQLELLLNFSQAGIQDFLK